MAGNRRWRATDMRCHARANGPAGNGVAPRLERREFACLSVENPPIREVFLLLSYVCREWTDMKIFVGLDDTDTVDSSTGTGHLARLIMSELITLRIAGYGITRHQLLFDRRIPYTAKNSANVIHLLGDAADIPAIVQCAQAVMRAHFQPGSDPGLCVGTDIPKAIVAFGRRAQREIVGQEDAQCLAEEYGLALHGLGGTNGGIIGALAGVGLASSGDDGRFTHVGRTRDLQGIVSVSDVLAAGVSAIRTRDGNPIREGRIQTFDKIRPALRAGQPVLYVEPTNGYWQAVRLD